MTTPHTNDTAPDAYTVVGTAEVRMTTDYDAFKVMAGNRKINRTTVNRLKLLIEKNGNLTGEFPIVVDRNGYIIDGQHRYTALKELGGQIGYRVLDNATIDTVRSINQGGQNWSWRNLAESYAALGNTDYEWFLRYVDHYGLRFNAALVMVGSKSSRSNGTSKFNSGEMVIEDKAKAYDLAEQLVQIERLVGFGSHDLEMALITLMKSPHYDHGRMVAKLRQGRIDIPTKARITDYQRILEEVFNYGYQDDNRLRLF